MPRVNKKRVIKTRNIVKDTDWNDFIKNAGLFWLLIMVFVLGLFVFVLAKQQMILSAQQEKTKLQSNFVLPESHNPTWQYLPTKVNGLYLAYKQCPIGFSGACDDAMLYKLADGGTKQVLVRSLRALQDEVQDLGLLQPIKQDGDKLLFRNWVFGSNPNNNDKRFWLYRLSDMSLLVYSDQVPLNSIFSSDYKYAAYVVRLDNDIRDLMIVNLDENRTVSGAKAKKGWTFMNKNGEPEFSWKDNKHLIIKEFKLPYDSNKVTEKIIKLK